MCGCLSCAPYWGPGLQPRNVPGLVIQSAIPWLAGHSVHWATLARVFFKDFLFIFREKGREGERNGEKHWLVAPRRPPTGDPSSNPNMCPDQELNQWPLWSMGQCPTYWATPVRAHTITFAFRSWKCLLSLAWNILTSSICHGFFLLVSDPIMLMHPSSQWALWSFS